MIYRSLGGNPLTTPGFYGNIEAYDLNHEDYSQLFKYLSCQYLLTRISDLGAFMMNMHLTIRNFGPIRSADIDFDKYTFFIGEQGTGKSTIVKLFSCFTWCEKALARHQYTGKQLSQQFVTTHLKFHNIASYISSDPKVPTKIVYTGLYYDFTLEGKSLQVTEKSDAKEAGMKLAKVIYVPAERMILSCVGKTADLNGLSDNMAAFAEDFWKAESVSRKGYKIPFADTFFTYDAANKIGHIKGDGYDIRLSESSSGYQSSLPMLLVSDYLSDMVLNDSHNPRLSPDEMQRMQKDVEEIMNNGGYSDAMKKVMLQNVSSRYSYARFVNIVEEPELNLYPQSQKDTLYELVRAANKIEDNQLVSTTHSPYIINYLSIAVEAENIHRIIQNAVNTNETKTEAFKSAGDDAAGLMKELDEIIPEACTIDSRRLKIYEVSEGTVQPLELYNGIPSDENFLNAELADCNDIFDELLDIKDRVKKIYEHK